MLSPAIDLWLEKVGNSINVIRPYKNDTKEYLRQMKDRTINENKQIKAYFNSINQKNPSAFKAIQNWITAILAGKL